ncbi:MAG: hypothetical protein LBE91_07190 [Tannerella sp.]|nr:hypothetical protein [Tannerella sp.]
MGKKIIYSDILKASWRRLLKQFWLLVGLMIGFTIIYSLLYIFAMPAKGGTVTVSGFIISLLITVLGIIFTMGYMKNCFQTIDGEEPQFSAYGQVSRKFFTFWFAGIILSVIVVIGLFLLVLPGIYMIIRLRYYGAAIVDEDAGIIESLKRSWQITKGQELPLFIILLIIIGIICIGTIALIVGIFVAAPYIMLIDCVTFRKLTAPAATD